MTDPEIRTYRACDEPRVRAISTRRREGFAPGRSPDRVAETIDGWIDAALASASDDDHLVLVADDAEAGVIGFIAVTVQEHDIGGPTPPSAELRSSPERRRGRTIRGVVGLTVDSAHGGEGVGTALVARATTWANDQGCGHLTLRTGAANHGARWFDERLGFEYEDVSLARAVVEPRTP